MEFNKSKQVECFINLPNFFSSRIITMVSREEVRGKNERKSQKSLLKDLNITSNKLTDSEKKN